ncbi:MAG: restriction endonuclease subunit S [Litorimonas sp.]
MKSNGSEFRPGDVMYGRLRPYLNKVVAPHFHGAASAEFIVFPQSEALDPGFLKYLLHQMPFVQFANERSSGDRPRVKHEDLIGFQYRLPPLAEQKRIVSKIDELFSAIEAGERAVARARASLARYRKAILKAAVTGELTADWRAANPPTETAEALLTRIRQARYDAWEISELEKLDAKGMARPKTEKQWERFRSRFTGPDAAKLEVEEKLPKSWCWTKFGSCFDIFTGATPSRKKPKYWNGKIPWVSSGEVAFCNIRETVECITKEGYLNSSVKLHPEGTVLLAMIGEGKTRGQSAILKIAATNNQNAAAIRVSETPILEDYIYDFLFLRYEVSRAEGQGGNQPALNARKVASIVFPLPPIDEQREIVSRVEVALSRADAVEASLDGQTRQARALKQAILKRAFAGELVEQDPNDEPASELLKRIMAA